MLVKSIFIIHDYLQHLGSEWESDHVMRYHQYLIPTNLQMVDSVVLAYTWSCGVTEARKNSSYNEL